MSARSHYSKVKELLASGVIGQLDMVAARWDRNSSIGAWSYTPNGASPDTFDWPRFLGSAPNPVERRALVPVAQMT